MSGLWEVRVRSEKGGVRVLYADPTGTYVIDGSIYELRTNRDLTEERTRKLNAIKFESLPLDQAVKCSAATAAACSPCSPIPTVPIACSSSGRCSR